jgi:hypothetical protein
MRRRRSTALLQTKAAAGFDEKGTAIRRPVNADRGASGSGDMLVAPPKEGRATFTDLLSQIAKRRTRTALQRDHS